MVNGNPYILIFGKEHDHSIIKLNQTNTEIFSFISLVLSGSDVFVRGRIE